MDTLPILNDFKNSSLPNLQSDVSKIAPRNITQPQLLNQSKESNNYNSQNSPFFKKYNLIDKNISFNYPKNYSYNKIKLKKLLFRDNYLIQNQSFMTNTSSNYYDVVKSQLSKRRNNNKSFDSYINSVSFLREKKYEEKKNILKEKIREKEYRINKIKKLNKSILLSQTKDNKNKNEMKLIKIKLHKIFKENNIKICDLFERKNNAFNKKLKHYFKTNKFIKGKKEQESNFSPNKKDFYSSHNISDFYYDLDSNMYKVLNEEFITKAVVNSFNDREKKIISLAPKYFLIHKKNFLLKKLKVDSNETLKDKLQKEEDIEKLKNQNKSEIKNIPPKVKNKSNDDKGDKGDNNIFRKKVIIKKINIFNGVKPHKVLDKTQIHFVKYRNKKNISEYVNKEIKNSFNKYNLFCAKNSMDNIDCKGNDDYYKMFNFPLSYNMTREYILDKNNERLDKEEIFHYMKEKNKNDNDLIKNTISKYQSIMRENYKDKMNNLNIIT